MVRVLIFIFSVSLLLQGLKAADSSEQFLTAYQNYQQGEKLERAGNNAEAVKKYFVSKGIADSRLTPIGFGQDKPIADNKTPAGKAKNRRVAFEVSMLP